MFEIAIIFMDLCFDLFWDNKSAKFAEMSSVCSALSPRKVENINSPFDMWVPTVNITELSDDTL